MSDFRQCPFDPLHIIAAKTFALHLVKCKRQHPDVKLVSCHFDTSHLVKEEELREHMKTCSGRNHLLQYKTTVNRMPVGGKMKLPDPAENLIYNTGEPSKTKAVGGITLQDDSECWDDYAYKAYDPLENCKTKLKSGKAFIIPNANRFAGQMQAAAGLKAELAPDDSVTLNEPVAQTEDCDSVQSEEQKFDITDSAGPSKDYSIRESQPIVYESEIARNCSDSKHHKNRDVRESYSSRRHESRDETYHRRERSRSDSTSSTDRKSDKYSRHYDAHNYRTSYESSHSRHRRDRYEEDRNSSYKERHERHTDSDSSDRSYKNSKHTFRPYQRYM